MKFCLSGFLLPLGLPGGDQVDGLPPAAIRIVLQLVGREDRMGVIFASLKFFAIFSALTLKI